ncbi:MAG: hypothetical protein WBD37_13760 [Anderseniella sp.]
MIYLTVVWKLLPQTLEGTATPLKPTLFIIAGLGLAMRVVLFGSHPVMEDDYHRYMWDGALTANGFNPWAYAPSDVLDGKIVDPVMTALKAEAGDVLMRINYSELRSIYPAVPQAFFAIAYFIKPFSLDAWRFVLLGLELVTFGLLLALLSTLKRPLLWVTIYWWNPIVIKEVANSGHMEPTLIVPLLAGVLLAVRARPVAASFFTSIAVAAKVWPVLFLPIVWRDLFSKPRLLALCVGVAALTSTLLYLPIITTQLDSTSGFVAFATEWERISASFIILSTLTALLPQNLLDPELIARLMAAGLVGAIVLWNLRHTSSNSHDLVKHLLIAIAALLLLSPVQLPWYFIWVVPLLCIYPSRGLLLMTVCFPLYYAFFKLTALEVDESLLMALVWTMWLPVWGVLAYDWSLDRRNSPS